MSAGLKGLSEFDAVVKGWFLAVEEAAAEAAVGLAHNAFEEILENGPQFSGDFVANTRVSMTGSPDTTFEEGLGGGASVVGQKVQEAFGKGDEPAQTAAKTRAVWTTPKLGTPIFISSTAKHDEFYSHKIEDGEIKLRPVNQGADHIYRKATSNTQHKYATIGKVQLADLRKKTL